MLVGELVEGDMSDMGHIGATCEIDTGKGFVWLLMDECLNELSSCDHSVLKFQVVCNQVCYPQVIIECN